MRENINKNGKFNLNILPLIKKYGFIDSFRGIAILLVLLTHTNYIFPPDSKLAHSSFFGLVQFGSRGVQLFFMVSAFTLFNSYYINLEKGSIGLRRFFIKRFFRIAPLFYLCIIAMTINIKFNLFENYMFFSNTINNDIIENSISNLNYWYLTTFTFTNGFIPKYIGSPYPGGWSIAVEFSFYMTLPFLFSKIKNLKISTIITIIAMLASSSIILLQIQNTKSASITFLYTSIVNQFFFFSLGITAFYFHFKKESFTKSIKFLFYFILFYSIAISIYSRFMLIGVIFFLLILISQKYNFLLLNNKLLQYIGKISFSIYCTQWWLIIALSKFPGIQNYNYIIVYLFFVFINILFSTLTYLFIEKRFIFYGEQLIKKINL